MSGRVADLAGALPRAALELCWLYAWSAFVLSFVAGTYGMTSALAVFVGAWALTAALRGRGLRALVPVALHALGLGASVLLVARTALQGAPFEAGLRCALAVGFTLAFWWSGSRHAQRSADYSTVCARFDHGLLWLFALLLLRLLLRDELPDEDHGAVAEVLVFAYLVVGLLAVFRARNRELSVAHARFLRGYRGAFLAACFALALLVCAGAASLLALPGLHATLAAGARELEGSADPIGRGFLLLLRLAIVILFWLSTLFDPVAPPPPNVNDGEFKRLKDIDVGLLSDIDQVDASWVLTPWAVAAALVAFGYLYSRRTALRTEGVSGLQPGWLRGWSTRLQRWLAGWLRARRQPEPVRLYRALLRWGKRCGVACRPEETPIEYALRLRSAVRGAGQPIDALVAAFNAHAFGSAGPSAPELRGARAALRRLHSPGLWPARARAWLRT